MQIDCEDTVIVACGISKQHETSWKVYLLGEAPVPFVGEHAAHSAVQNLSTGATTVTLPYQWRVTVEEQTLHWE